MANFMFNSAINLIKKRKIDLINDDIKAVLVDFNLPRFFINKNHRYFSDVPSDCIVSNGCTLSGKTYKKYIFDANDITFENFCKNATGILIYRNNPLKPEFNNLIAFIDTAPGLPLKGNGGNIIVTWDNKKIKYLISKKI